MTAKDCEQCGSMHGAESVWQQTRADRLNLIFDFTISYLSFAFERVDDNI